LPSIKPWHKSPLATGSRVSAVTYVSTSLCASTVSHISALPARGPKCCTRYCQDDQGRRPFQIIHVDHLGPFETSMANNKYLLMIADNLTKYVHLYPCGTTNPAGVIRLLKKFCDDRGILDRIISDRSTCFTSRKFHQFCLERKITHTLNSTRYSQANGQVERANRTIIPLLSLSTTDQRR